MCKHSLTDDINSPIHESLESANSMPFKDFSSTSQHGKKEDHELSTILEKQRNFLEIVTEPTMLSTSTVTFAIQPVEAKKELETEFECYTDICQIRYHIGKNLLY